MQRRLLRRLMLILDIVGTMWVMWLRQLVTMAMRVVVQRCSSDMRKMREAVGVLCMCPTMARLVVACHWWTMHRVWVLLLLHQVALRLRLGSRLASRPWLMVRARRMLRRQRAWLLVRQ